MTEGHTEDPTFLLHAALDGELDAAGAMEVEARLAADPGLAAEYARLATLRDAIRARLARERAPDRLRARVMAIASTPRRFTATAPQRYRPLVERYGSLAASLMLGIVLGGGVYALLAGPSAGDDVQREIVAGFIRGRLSDQAVDIATSDRHTVKPWFAGKIAGATTVVDLKAEGFALIGGRIDVVGATPVATLVYQRREHQIALTEIPAFGVGDLSVGRRESRDGYSLLEWAESGRLYAVVSDLPLAEIETFVAAFRRAAAAEREDALKP